MRIIAAVDKNWAIGYNGDLLFKLPEDMRNFKTITKKYGIVLMGRKTFESLNIEDGLPERENWVVTRDKDYQFRYPNIKVFNSIDDVLKYIRDPYTGEERIDHNKICVIGGGEIYKEFLPYCNEAIITILNKEFENTDTFFPCNLDKDSNWIKSESIKGEECLRIGQFYTFNKYSKVSVIDPISYHFSGSSIIEPHQRL